MTSCACESLLTELRAAGVSLWLDGDALTVWPASRLTPAQIEALRAHKPAIIEAHRRRVADLLPPDAVCRAWRAKYANTARGALP